MRRVLVGALLAAVAALIISACGGPGVTPSPTPGGGGPGGGGGQPPPPPPPNNPPQIKSITVSDTRVEVGSPVTLTAVVEDEETPVANLTYEWSADTGTFTGTGAIVTWSPGTDAKTPADYVVTLTVTERYSNGTGTAEHKVTGTATAHVNNSLKELADMSLRFLSDFTNSTVSADKCVSEFSDSCKGDKADELRDISNNRHDFLILASSLRHTGIDMGSSRTKATVHTFCSFTSRVITQDPRSCTPQECPFNSVGTTQGDCWTTNVYENGRWWLCASHYTGQSSVLTVLERAFFGIRRLELP